MLKQSGYVNRKFGTLKSRNKKFNFQLILKPNSGTGSSNIKKYKRQTELIKNKINTLSNKDFYIYEEYIKGQEYSLELFFYKNNVIFKQLVKKKINSRFVEIAHISSKKINNFKLNLQNKLINYLKKLKLGTCFLHIELKFINNKIEIIEINPRLCGGNITSLIKHSTNVDLIKNFLKIIKKNHLSKNDLKKTIKENEYKITYIIPTLNKKIKKIKIKQSNDILEKKIYSNKLSKYFKLQNNFEDRLGHLIHKNEKKFDISKQYKIIY